jgi:hypothetical protein
VRQPCRLPGQKPADLLKQQRLLVLLALEFGRSQQPNEATTHRFSSSWNDHLIMLKQVCLVADQVEAAQIMAFKMNSYLAILLPYLLVSTRTIRTTDTIWPYGDAWHGRILPRELTAAPHLRSLFRRCILPQNDIFHSWLFATGLTRQR